MSTGSAPDPALLLDRVAKIYGRTVALRATSLVVETGEILGLLGPNGSGKTTLLKIVAGAITPTAGRGSIFGKDMLRERTVLRADVGLLAGESYLYDDLSATENLRFVNTMSGSPDRGNAIEDTLRRVGLARAADERVRNFSSGMKQRLSLARLDLLHPRLLLLDEPYNSLDAAGADLVDDMLKTASREGRAAIVATHDAERARVVADRVAVLEDGRLTYLGAPAAYRRDHRVG
ncbi:MAG: ABC transporter ATP-binding protein [Chloroflexota bacterium]